MSKPVVITKEIILRSQRGMMNDCYLYCVDCPQAEEQIQMLGEEDNKKNKKVPITKIIFYRCAMPPGNSVTYNNKERGRGKFVKLTPEQIEERNELLKKLPTLETDKLLNKIGKK